MIRATRTRGGLATVLAVSIILPAPALAQAPGESPDPPARAREWTEVTGLPTGLTRQIASGVATLGPAIVLVGGARRGPATWVSADGSSWASTRLPGVRGTGSAADVAAWDGGLVAVGHEGRGKGKQRRFDGLVWTSTDGSSWTREKVVRNASFMQVLASSGGVAVLGTAGEGSVPTLWRQDDGTGWRATAIDPATEGAILWMDVARSDDGTWLACYAEMSPDGSAAVTHRLRRSSDDGATWGPVVGPGAPPLECGDLETLPTGFLMSTVAPGGPDGTRTTLWSSPDGETWQEAASWHGLVAHVGSDRVASPSSTMSTQAAASRVSGRSSGQPTASPGRRKMPQQSSPNEASSRTSRPRLMVAST